MIIHIENNSKGQAVSAEQFKYKLSSAIMAKERWQSDDDAKTCARCDKSFIYLIRRKHHCRRCGQVFCGDCADNFLDGHFFSPESEKTVRFCVKCYDQLTRYLKRQGVDIQNTSNIITLSMAKEEETSQILQNDEVPSNTSSLPQAPPVEQEPPAEQFEHNDQEFNPDIEEQINIQALFADDEVSQAKGTTLSQEELIKYSNELKERSQQKVEQLCDFLAKKYSIGPEWQQIMPHFIKRAVDDINIDSISASGEPMDINYYVKIKKIPFEDQSVTGYFKGVVFRKNVVHKKMKTKFNHPKLMIITGNLDGNEKIATSNSSNSNFETLAANEKKNQRRISDKIARLKPDILLVEKCANRMAVEYLLSANIAVVQNIQQHILRKIAKSTRAKFVNLEKVEKYQPEQVLGQATNLVFRNYNAEIILQNKELMESLNVDQKEHLNQYIRENKDRDNTLMFIETVSGQSGVTITLSGPQIKELKQVKKSIMGILRLARHFHLERELILYEHRLKSSLKLSKDQILQVNSTTGDLTKFIYERQPIEELIRRDAISYTKINYVQADLSNFNDIKDNHQALEQYFKENHPISSSKVDFFAEICQIPTLKKIEFYSKDDTSLAAFILMKVTNMENKCSCRRARYQHVSIYYGSGVYIRIAAESKVFLADRSISRPSIPNQRQPNPTMIDRAQSLVVAPQLSYQGSMTSSAMAQTQQDSLQHAQTFESPAQTAVSVITQKDLAKALAKKHKNQNQVKKVVIESYIECNQCLERITDSVRLKKINMEYSFLRFLQHLLISGQSAKEVTGSGEKKDKCDHSSCSRVFVYEESMVKFYVSTFKYFSVSQINLSDEKTAEHLKKWESQAILQKKEDLKTRLHNMKDKLIIQVQKVQGQLTSEQKLLKGELDLLCNSITKIYNEALRKINGSYKCLLEVELDSHNMGMCFKDIYDNLLESKKKKELGNDIKIMMKNQLIEPTITRTEKDIDHPNHSDDYLLENGSVHSEKEIHTADDLNQGRRNSRIKKARPSGNNLGEELLDETHEAPAHAPPHVRQSFMQGIQAQGTSSNASTSDFVFQKEWPMTAYPWEYEKTERTIQKHEFVPIFESDHMSQIGFALNHSKYMHEVYLKEGFQNFENQKFPELTNQTQFDFVKSKLAQGSVNKELEKDMTFVVRISHEKPSKKIEQSPAFVAEDTPRNIALVPKQKGTEIILYFPVQFEMLRMINGISLSQFIKSVTSMVSWDTQGGKSDSSFYKSSDELFIFKKLSLDREFTMFKDFAMEYFKHMWRLSYENKPSLLSKIFGMFEIRSKNGVGYYLAMENLFVGMGPSSGLQVYDLKGSKTNRWEQKKKRVLLDTNFKIDRNAEPIPVARDNFRFIDRAFQNDCKFLNKQKVVDYSLLCIINKKQQKIRLGIIDYLRQYTWDKETEHYIKLVMKRGMVPTIVNPDEYKKRFLEEMIQYFIDVGNEC